nr:MAG TPA: Protein of unknown function (DUF3079) [Caudoviricetes sp.]
MRKYRFFFPLNPPPMHHRHNVCGRHIRKQPLRVCHCCARICDLQCG